MGPTAVGKSKLLEELIERNDRFVFISCDSRKIYRGLDIGTNKPKSPLRGFFKLIDIIEPDQHYNAQEFAKAAKREVINALSSSRIPLVVGGTPLYYRALFFGLFEAPPPDPHIRKTLLDRCKRDGVEALYEELKRVDLETAQKLHPRDWIRITRALEVYYQVGVPISRLRKERVPKNLPRPIAFGLMRDRKDLYRRINDRVDRMIKEGLLEEVKEILQRGFSQDSPGLRTIGYEELVRHLKGEISFEEAVRLIKKRTRIYSRKQMYFFRSLGPIKWYKLPDQNPIDEILRVGKRIP